MALVTRALHSSSLLAMLGVRPNYVDAIFYRDGGDIDCVTCGHDTSAMYIFWKSHTQARFWMNCSGQRSVSPYINRKLVKWQILSIESKSRCEDCGKDIGDLRKLLKINIFTKRGVTVLQLNWYASRAWHHECTWLKYTRHTLAVHAMPSTLSKLDAARISLRQLQ